jgi:hypothetical protein
MGLCVHRKAAPEKIGLLLLVSYFQDITFRWEGKGFPLLSFFFFFFFLMVLGFKLRTLHLVGRYSVT